MKFSILSLATFAFLMNGCMSAGINSFHHAFVGRVGNVSKIEAEPFLPNDQLLVSVIYGKDIGGDHVVTFYFQKYNQLEKSYGDAGLVSYSTDNIECSLSKSKRQVCKVDKLEYMMSSHWGNWEDQQSSRYQLMKIKGVIVFSEDGSEIVGGKMELGDSYHTVVTLTPNHG